MLKWVQISGLLAAPLPSTWLGSVLAQIITGQPLLDNVSPDYAPWVIAMAVERWWLIAFGLVLIVYCVYREVK